MSESIETRLPALFDSVRQELPVPRDVYRRLQFFASVMRHAPAPMGATALLVWFNEKGAVNSFNIGAGGITAGRDSNCDVVLPGTMVSRRHCRLTNTSGAGEGVVVEDLGSANGTMVNGSRLEAHLKYELHDGDVIEIGNTALACVESAPKI